MFLTIQPFGFEAREYLRKTLVAKEIDFVVDNLAPSGREYISIPFEGKLIQEELLLRGLAKLRPNAVKYYSGFLV
jgi:endonuclease YncB( thermonuclease family)